MIPSFVFQKNTRAVNDKGDQRKTENKEKIHLADDVHMGKRGPLRIAITIVGIAAAVAISIAAYYLIKSYVLKAIAFFFLLKAWVVAPFAWAKRFWVSLTDLRWVFAPFFWLFACVKRILMVAVELVAKIKVGKPRFVELDAWMEWLKRPEWLRWRGGALHVPEIVENGFEVFVPDGIQAIEDVIEEL